MKSFNEIKNELQRFEKVNLNLVNTDTEIIISHYKWALSWVLENVSEAPFDLLSFKEGIQS